MIIVFCDVISLDHVRTEIRSGNEGFGFGYECTRITYVVIASNRKRHADLFLNVFMSTYIRVSYLVKYIFL